MARIPTANELGNVSARTATNIARVSTPQLARPKRQVPSFSGINVGSDISALGRSISDVGVILERKAKQDDAIDAVRAEAHDQKEHINLRRELENDPDYETYGERFDKRSNKIAETSANLIRDPELREKWQLQASVRRAKIRDQVLRAGVKKDRQAKQTALVESLENHRDIYIAPGSDSQKVQARADMEAAIIASERTGLISPSQGLRLRKQFVEGAVKADGETQLRNDPIGLKEDLQGKGTFRRWLEKRESTDNPTAVNQFGFAGLYQFGAPRLVDLGFYKPGEGESVKDGKWTGKQWGGTFDIPGHPDVKTLEDFLTNAQAQRTAFAAHVQLMDREIARNKLDRFEGQVVGGVKITRESLYAMIHLAGPGGAKRVLESGFVDNPADAFGTTARDYAAQAATTSKFSELDALEKAKLNESANIRIERARRTLLKAQEKQRKELSAIVFPTEARQKVDPAAYVLKHDQESATAFTVIDEALSDPETDTALVEQQADKILDRQRAIGVNNNFVKLLPVDQAKATVRQLENASPEQVAGGYFSMKAKWGRHWPRVAGELVEQGLSSSYQLLVAVDDSNVAVQAVAEIVNVEESSLRSATGTDARTTERDLLAGVEADTAEFLGAFAAGGDVTQGNGILQAVRKVALNVFRKTGDEAGARAFAVGLLTDRFDTVVSSNSRVLLPKETGLTERQLEAAMRGRQTDETLRAFEPVLNDPSRSGFLNREAAIQNAVRQGVWVTNAAGDGVQLMHVFPGGGLLPVRNAKNEPFELKFDEVVGLTAERTGPVRREVSDPTRPAAGFFARQDGNAPAP